jgi:RimJ/RimL family protein N-acetyltransferase
VTAPPPAAPPAPPLAPVVLEGAHVRLEPLAPAHLDALCEVGLDPALWALSLSRIATRDDMRRYLEAALDERARGLSLPFAQVDRASGRVAGSTRFGNYEPRHRRVEIGWTWLAAPWQRTALNTEAKRLLLAHAFEALGLNRVELKTDARNARSRAAMRRLGAAEEGTFRRHMITDTGYVRDSVYFSVTAEEWPRVRAGLDARLALGSPAAGVPPPGAAPAPNPEPD